MSTNSNSEPLFGPMESKIKPESEIRQPLLVVRVALSQGKVEDIHVFPGDTPESLATEFAECHKLSANKVPLLVGKLRQEMDMLLAN